MLKIYKSICVLYVDNSEVRPFIDFRFYRNCKCDNFHAFHFSICACIFDQMDTKFLPREANGN